MSILIALNPVEIITFLGYTGLFGIILAESGLFFGFFLPGDSLLFTAGLMASGRILNIWALVILIPIAAIIGDSIGYWFGSWIGPRIFTKEDSLLFNKRYIARAQSFYAKYGSGAIILARFIPVVRTFVPILAGVAMMRYKTFIFYNIIGGVLWGAGVTLLGYFLGKTVPGAQDYLLPITLVILIISFLPVAREWWKAMGPKD